MLRSLVGSEMCIRDSCYPSFNRKLFDSLTDRFNLDPKRKISSFSKGMKKQVSILLGLCSGTKYLLCDETFDGLDPVVRQAVKSLFAAEILNRDFTPIISSHNLRELEDFCDSIGLDYVSCSPFRVPIARLAAAQAAIANK